MEITLQELFDSTDIARKVSIIIESNVLLTLYDGTPCFMEWGGGYSSTGCATIICDSKGEKKSPIWYEEICLAGHISALFKLEPGDFIIYNSRWHDYENGRFVNEIIVKKVLGFDIQNKKMLAEDYEGVRFDTSEETIFEWKNTPPEFLKTAIKSAISRSYLYHCRKLFYANLENWVSPKPWEYENNSENNNEDINIIHKLVMDLYGISKSGLPVMKEGKINRNDYQIILNSKWHPKTAIYKFKNNAASALVPVAVGDIVIKIFHIDRNQNTFLVSIRQIIKIDMQDKVCFAETFKTFKYNSWDSLPPNSIRDMIKEGCRRASYLCGWEDTFSQLKNKEDIKK